MNGVESGAQDAVQYFGLVKDQTRGNATDWFKNSKRRRNDEIVSTVKKAVDEHNRTRYVRISSFAKGGSHMSHVIPFLLLGRISKRRYLPIECQTVAINVKQQDLGASGLCVIDIVYLSLLHKNILITIAAVACKKCFQVGGLFNWSHTSLIIY